MESGPTEPFKGINMSRKYESVDDIPQEIFEKMSLEELVEYIPYEGWWKSGSRDTYVILGKLLVNRGFTPIQAFDFLQSCYSAAAECFGG
jgi:hypothetical protein